MKSQKPLLVVQPEHTATFLAKATLRRHLSFLWSASIQNSSVNTIQDINTSHEQYRGRWAPTTHSPYILFTLYLEWVTMSTKVDATAGATDFSAYRAKTELEIYQMWSSTEIILNRNFTWYGTGVLESTLYLTAPQWQLPLSSIDIMKEINNWDGLEK